VLFNLQALREIELTVDITVDQRLRLWANQFTTPKSPRLLQPLTQPLAGTG
jgi:hypothetical protein